MPRPMIPVETLIEQLHSSDWMARCDAARLLGQSRDPRAVDALLPDLNDTDWRVRRNAAQALGVLRDQRAVEALLLALNDRTMTVRQRAIVALGRIKDSRALPALIEIVLEDKHESYDAAQAIRKFGKKGLPELAKAFERTGNRDLMMLLIEMKYDGAFDLTLKMMQSPQASERLVAIRELGKLGDKKAVPYLIEQIHQRDPLIQSEAIGALAKLGAVETVPLLLDLLVDDELYGPRAGVYHAVTDAFQVFAGITDEIKNAFPGKYPAMFSMGGAPFSLPEVMGLVGKEGPPQLKDMISNLQSGTHKPVDVPGLPPEVIHAMFENMRWNFGVMFADAQDASQERVKRLRELLNSGLSMKRAAAALTLPWYTDESSLAALEQATQDPDEIVRKAATWAVSALQKAISYRNQFGM